MTDVKRPACVTDEHLEYLDELRDSGATNMYGAGAYLERSFSVSGYVARDILGYWMDTFGDPNR